MAEVSPISIKRLIKPRKNVTKAISPKSDFSKYLARIEILSIPIITRMIVESEVHLTPEMVFFLICMDYIMNLSFQKS